jgi:nucleoside-diphosphate kinase|eukprot:TRINITY_DN81318_c0_g1_i1.p1 TRINITY_DN81318_c0_g1~~TRINITY_DN81318_c0_g1_i1.p1  ORF type:complete len:162 (-),score=25.96 TRINITY_DN81318_c0_g1_i1:36-521(-)
MSSIAGVAGTKSERTFIAIKPDGVQRNLVGEIIKRFENKGFKLCGMKLFTPSTELTSQHYSDLSAKPFFKGLVDYMSSGPVVAMCWEGLNVIKTGRVMLGATNPADSAPGTIRGDFAVEVGRNVCHGSDSHDSAVRELTMWFGESQLYSYNKVTECQVYEK